MEEKIIYDVEVKGVQSIENLTKANKELREERKKLDLQSEQGQKRAQEINKQLDANTETIKQNSSALEKQRLNVGNYSGALDKLVPGLGATANGFSAMKATALSFIATPIGAVIGALGLVLAAVTKYLTGTTEGAGMLNKIMAVTGAIVGKVSDAISFLGEYAIKGVIKSFSILGDIIDKVIPGFNKLLEIAGKKLNEALNDPIGLANMKTRLTFLERLLIARRAELEVEIAQQKTRAEDKENLTIKERLEAIKRAKDAQDELNAKQAEYLKLQYEIVIATNNQSESSDEDKKKQTEAYAALILVQKDNADKSKELLTKEIELRSQLNAQINEQAALEAANRRAASETANAEEVTINQLHKDTLITQELDFSKAILNSRLSLNARVKVADENAQKNKELVQKMEVESQLQTLSALGNLLGRFRSKNKVAAAGEALINTFLGVTRILQAPATPFVEPFASITRGINIAATLVSGFNAIRQINSTPAFAMGGKVTDAHGTKINRSNGDNILATVKTGEVILNERQQAMLGGDATFRRMGVPGFATGGIVSASAKKSESISFQMQLYDAISRIQPVVTVEDINAGVRRVNVIESRAQVI
jgi:hypothetical protein